MTHTSYSTYVQCSLGLEEVTRRELSELGWNGQIIAGGVELRLNWDELVQLCLVTRSAESVRVRLKKFQAKNFEAFKQQLAKLPFRAFLAPGTPVVVQVVCHRSKLWHSGAVQQRAMEVLLDHVGCIDGSAESKSQMVHIRLDQDEVQVSLDAGGSRMHKRGYRPHVEKASLRESIAFAVCDELARLTPPGESVVVWDPFCGAGTLVLEWNHMRSGHLAGEHRNLSLKSWRGFNEERFKAAYQAAQTLAGDRADRLKAGEVWGSDLSERAVSAARHNAEQSQMNELGWLQGDVREVAKFIPEGAWILTNPPYGKRLEDCSGVKSLLKVLSERPDIPGGILLAGGFARELLPQHWPALQRFKNGGLSVSARQIVR